MEKIKFCKRFTLIMALVPTVILAICAIFFGKVVEPTLFQEVTKWVFMDLVITAIWTLFAGVFSPLIWHMLYDKKRDEE